MQKQHVPIELIGAAILRSAIVSSRMRIDILTVPTYRKPASPSARRQRFRRVDKDLVAVVIALMRVNPVGNNR